MADLNQVLSLHHGKQFVAAAEKVGRLVEKHGPRACLLGLQTHILIHLKEYEQAGNVNQEFLKANPRNPLGHQHAALLMAAEGRTSEAIEALQDGLDACFKNEIPITMANAFRTVGMMLMSQGHVVAGRAHLIFASELRGGEDEMASQLIMQTFRSAEIPLLLKSEFPVFVPEDDHDQAWTRKYANATRFASVGRWRAARTLTQQLIDEHPNQPELHYSVSVWSMYLADTEQAVRSMRQYSELDSVDFDQRVEARATCFAIDRKPITGSYDFVQTTFALDDDAVFNEMALACKQIINGSIYSQEFIDVDSPPPQAAFLMLDLNEIRSQADVGDNDFPRVIAEILLYGRQTDRAPRIEFFSVRDSSFEQTLESFRELSGDTVKDKTDDATVEQIDILDHEMSVKWHLPPDMSMENRQAFVRQQKQREYLEILPNIPFPALNDRSFQEVIDDNEYHLEVAALVMMMEQGADALASDTFDFNVLREKLGLPSPGAIDAQTKDFDQLSPVEMQRIDFEQLPDESLVKAYVLASSCGNIRVLRSSGPVILSRPEMEKYIRFEMIYVVLARLSADTDESLELMQKARKHATAADRSIGGLLIDELELRLERNRPEGCQELLRVLQANHLKDPQNQYRLAAVLQRFGIMGPDGKMRAESMEPSEPVAAAASGEIWTPGDEARASSEDDSGQSGLWLPD